ncbi:PREDICTED: beta-defensin 105-like [Miniopterus natalensis]|uniref:beta-defensin 105-like n=1 Tax=Miniopterus natalensis TaxID=291302 RepID=UPI0007A6C5DD|nr:PREDICTED: beta-defensin 105-like [Miniopterus natalensis]
MAPSRKMVYFVFVFVFILAQGPSGCQAGLEHSQPFPGGEFSACEQCKLGRGKCRRVCTEDEKVVGNCKLNFLCCQRRVS